MNKKQKYPSIYNVDPAKKISPEKAKRIFSLPPVFLRLPNGFYKIGIGAVILSILLSACQAEGNSPTEINNTAPAISAGLPTEPSVNHDNTITVAPNATVAAEELNTLKTEINVKIAEAAESSDPIAKMLFDNSKRAEAAAAVFVKGLTSPENPKDNVLDPNSFFIGIAPDGVAYLRLEVDSVWGKAGEVGIVDTGENNGMFVTLSSSGVDGGQLSFEESGYYAAVKENGKVLKVVDTSKQWVDPANADKLKKGDLTEQMAAAYVDGQMEIDFDNLSNEEYEKLSVAITKELNDQIEAPIYFSENGQTTYADEETGKLETISNSEFEQRKKELAPNAYIPAKKDDDGTWMYLDEETKQYVRIEGSAGFDFDVVVDENNMDSGIIDWPTTPKTGEISYYRGSHPELTEARILLKDPVYEAYIPVILASNQIIEIPVQYDEDGSLQTRKALKVLVKEAYGFKEIYVVAPASRVSIQEENSPKDGAIGLDHETDGQKVQIKKLLIENQIYFLGFYKDQAKGLTSWAKININDVRGVVSAKDSFSNLTSDTNQSENKLLVILADMLIRHKQVP